MGLTIPNTFSAGTAAVAADVNANFTAVSSWANGNIVNADISTSASIAVSKLAANKEHLVLTFPVVADTTTTGLKSYIPLYNDGNGDWTIVSAQWICLDPGSANAVFRLIWGYSNGAGVAQETNASDAITVSGSDGVPTEGYSTAGMSTIAFDSNKRWLALKITTGGTASANLYVSVLLSRTIAAS